MSLQMLRNLTEKGETAKITGKVTPVEADQTLTYSSSDEKVLTVDSTGKVTAVGNGKAKVTVKTADGSISKEIEFAVNIPEPTPKTGDSNSVYYWLLLLVIALGFATLAGFSSKKRKEA